MKCVYYLCLFLPVFAQQIDVVIPVHRKDRPTLNHVISAIKENIEDVRRVIVISKEKFTDQAEWVDEKDFPFTIQDVADELGGDAGIGTNVRRGWYYQQLLKFYATFVIEDLLDNILIYDSDTIPNKKMQFIDDDGMLYMDIHDWGQPHFIYGIHMRKFLPDLGPYDRGVNPIVHHMVFNKEIIEDLFQRVEEHFERPFWKAFANLVITDHQKPMYLYLGASEYMIYYHFCMKHYRNRYIKRQINSVDDAHSFDLKISENYDFLSVHQYDRTE